MSMNPTPRSFDIGRVLGQMSQAVGGNAGVFFGLALLIYAVPTALMGGLQYLLVGSRMRPGQVANADPSLVATTLLVSLGIALVSIVTTYVLQAALTFGVISSLRGQRASIAECLSRGMRHFWSVFAIALIVGISVSVVAVLTFWLLFIPAIIIAIMWCVAVPAAVAESTGPLTALSRSIALTSGNWLMIFALGFIWVVVYGLALLLVMAVAMAFMAVSWDAYMLALSVVMGPLLSAVVMVLGSAMLASIYYELRQVKEGAGPDDLDAIFS